VSVQYKYTALRKYRPSTTRPYLCQTILSLVFIQLRLGFELAKGMKVQMDALP
jgi:hypothetical protein